MPFLSTGKNPLFKKNQNNLVSLNRSIKYKYNQKIAFLRQNNCSETVKSLQNLVSQFRAFPYHVVWEYKVSSYISVKERDQ